MKQLHERCIAEILVMITYDGSVYSTEACPDCIDFVNKHFGEGEGGFSPKK